MTQIGDTVYHFDINRRKYAPDGKGGPIYAGHFEPRKVVGEAKKSWLIRVFEGQMDSVAKATLEEGFGTKGYYTKAQMDDMIWVREHGHRIVTMVGHVRDAAILKAIAGVVGYTYE